MTKNSSNKNTSATSDPYLLDLNNSLLDSNSHGESALPPEGINTSNEHPLKDFSAMILAGIGIASVLIIGLSTTANWLAPKIPFHYEVALATRLAQKFPNSTPSKDASTSADTGTDKIDSEKFNLAQQRQKYLEKLTEKYLQAQKIDDDIKIRVHYIDDKNINAFATIGGHIFIHSGLFNRLHSENALAFVLGHEIGHISKRHPISALGRGLILIVSLNAMLGISDAALPDWLISQTTNITMLTFSREQEIDADSFAIAGVYKLYGHIDDADALFQYLKNQQSDNNTLEILTTHPLHDSRLKAIEDYAQRVQRLDQDQNLNQGQTKITLRRLTLIPAELLKVIDESPDPHSEKP